MSIDISDLRRTIVPKSDQLNAEQLLGGPMTITVTDVRAGSGEDQPISIHYANDDGRPFKPCKTMRKVLIHAWGSDGHEWVGKSMELYNDPAVRFGGMDVGGIRIARLTDIPKDIKVSLTATKGKKALHEIKVMRVEVPKTVDHVAVINAATTIDELKAVFAVAYKTAKDVATRNSFKAVYDKRTHVLTSIQLIDSAENEAAAKQVLEQARANLSADEMAELQSSFNMAWVA